MGTAGADRILGTKRRDVIAGLSGNDTIEGRGGADLICGGTGNDLIEGNGHTDQLFGGPGDDRIDVGPEADDPDLAPEIVIAGSGDDTIVERNLLRVLAAPGPGDDVIESNGTFTLDLSRSRRAVVVDLKDGISTGEGNDVLRGVDSVLGSRYDDVIIGNAAGNRLSGNGGSDRIYGMGRQDSLADAAGEVEGVYETRFWPLRDLGDDTLDGGQGNDYLSGTGGNDTYVGGDGIDELNLLLSEGPLIVDLLEGSATGDGRDTISGIENLSGSRFADVLLGDHGPNVILGSPEDAEDDDRIEGRGGNDTLYGSRGDDLLLGGPGKDRLDGSFDRDRCYDGEELKDCEVVARADPRGSPIGYVVLALGAAAALGAIWLLRTRKQR